MPVTAYQESKVIFFFLLTFLWNPKYPFCSSLTLAMTWTLWGDTPSGLWALVERLYGPVSMGLTRHRFRDTSLARASLRPNCESDMSYIYSSCANMIYVYIYICTNKIRNVECLLFKNYYYCSMLTFLLFQIFVHQPDRPVVHPNVLRVCRFVPLLGVQELRPMDGWTCLGPWSGMMHWSIDDMKWCSEKKNPTMCINGIT